VLSRRCGKNPKRLKEDAREEKQIEMKKGLNSGMFYKQAINIIIWLCIFNCLGKSNIVFSSYYNVKYLNCLENELPCYCEERIEEFITADIEQDTVGNILDLMYLRSFRYPEEYMYSIRKHANDKYSIRHGENENNSGGFELKAILLT
jgi:hypothetical protein